MVGHESANREEKHGVKDSQGLQRKYRRLGTSKCPKFRDGSRVLGELRDQFSQRPRIFRRRLRKVEEQGIRRMKAV